GIRGSPHRQRDGPGWIEYSLRTHVLHQVSCAGLPAGREAHGCPQIPCGHSIVVGMAGSEPLRVIVDGQELTLPNEPGLALPPIGVEIHRCALIDCERSFLWC